VNRTLALKYLLPEYYAKPNKNEIDIIVNINEQKAHCKTIQFTYKRRKNFLRDTCYEIKCPTK